MHFYEFNFAVSAEALREGGRSFANLCVFAVKKKFSSLLLVILLLHALSLHAQDSPESVKQAAKIQNADDPSQFFTRIEIYSELQYYDKLDVYLNQAVFRSIWKLGKRFTTRIDVPLVYNSFHSAENHQRTGLGDISFRLLGYKFREKPKSAFTLSLEISLNTAESRLLGTGKNMLIPVVSYTQAIPKEKMLFSLVLQQVNSISGDENRSDISFTKIQAILLKTWTKRAWTVVAPEWFVDYVHGGLSMNLRTRMAFAPAPRMNVWVSPSVGIFGDFPGRYQWGADVGGRYFLFKGMDFLKKK